MSRTVARIFAIVSVAIAGLAAASTAEATITEAFDGDVRCSVEADGVRFCGSDSPRATTLSFDGTPINAKIAFPPERSGAPDGNYPMAMLFHGYGGDRIRLNQMRRWLDRGYATFTMADRGFNESCGSSESREADPNGCEKGYIRLMDNRFEVRDAQFLAGKLADEGLIDPQRIAATGRSYGGGMSMALGVLKDRMVLENGSIVPWTSPNGTPMRIAAALPEIGWTDLAYSLAPNGSTLDYVADAPYRGRVGVAKEAQINDLYDVGQRAPGFYAPLGTTDTLSGDINGLRARIDAGEPYDPALQPDVDELTTNHSAYYIDHSTPPAPMLMANGFTDDLFPADEAIRLFNRTRTQFGPDVELGMFFGDFGHPRSQNKGDVTQILHARQDAWMDYYTLGTGPAPSVGVEAYTQTCPQAAPSGGPYVAEDWATIAPGELRLADRSTKTIDADSDSNGAFTKDTPGKACAQAPDADIPGAAAYEFDPAPAGGFTLLGSTTVIADFTLPGNTSQVAARLLDVAPDGQVTSVGRGFWRPATAGPTRQVFQFHPNGWKFAVGHVAKVELLATDVGRASDDQQDVTVSNLRVRMPVAEEPGSLAGLVESPAPKFVPTGYALASDFVVLDPTPAPPGPKPPGPLPPATTPPTADTKAPRVKLRAKSSQPAGKPIKVTVSCDEACRLDLKGRVKPKAERRGKLKPRTVRLDSGETRTVKLKLGKLEQVLRKADHGKVRVRATATDTAGNRSKAVKAKITLK